MYSIAYEETYKDGQLIFKEESHGDWVYIILSGHVQVSKTIEGKKYILEMLQPGDLFGELAFLGNIERTATARAIGETTVGIIDREFLDQEFNKIHSDFREILNSMVERFKKMIERSSGFLPRQETRVIDTLAVSYKNKSSFISSYTGNLSSGGLFIKTEKPLEKGEQFFLKLLLPGISNPLDIKCEVVWTREKIEQKKDYPPGMGVKFVEMTKKGHELLKKYLKGFEGSK
ncbi:MAG: TIGR02266 family protein [Thermodesulfobacteriota bacterium]|nr:TIGR02266 family protein [Thermodesulfobacteriota bacterium]